MAKKPIYHYNGDLPLMREPYPMKRFNPYLIVILLVSFFATSCTPLIIGGAITGVSAVVDRRAKGAIADDKIMEAAIFSQVKAKYPNIIDLRHITKISLPSLSVTSYNRKVLLAGIVENEQQRNEILRIAHSQKAVEKVYNYIDIQGQRNLGDFTNDSLISSKIRILLLNPKGFSPNDVKIETYGGVTYVFGLLTPQEQLNVSRQISTIAGVKKVVTFYETYVPTTNKTK